MDTWLKKYWVFNVFKSFRTAGRRLLPRQYKKNKTTATTKISRYHYARRKNAHILERIYPSKRGSSVYFEPRVWKNQNLGNPFSHFLCVSPKVWVDWTVGDLNSQIFTLHINFFLTIDLKQPQIYRCMVGDSQNRS